MITLQHYDPRSRHVYSDHGRSYQFGNNQYPGVSAILNGFPTGRKRDGQKNTYVSAAMTRGSLFHSVMEHHFRGNGDPIANTLADAQRSQVLPYWDSVKNVLPRISDIQLVESAVWHEVGHYAGTVDLVCSFDSRPVILDWKTTAQLKPMNCTRYFLQLSAYCGAVNRMYGTQIRHGVIVLLLPDAEAQILKFSLAHYWQRWLVKLIAYWQLTATPQSDQVLERIYSEYGITTI